MPYTSPHSFLQNLSGQLNDNALGDVRTCQNLHFDKQVSIGLKMIIQIQISYSQKVYCHKYISMFNIHTYEYFVVSQDATVCDIWWRYVKVLVS